jgi:hypothetical protein
MMAITFTLMFLIAATSANILEHDIVWPSLPQSCPLYHTLRQSSTDMYAMWNLAREEVGMQKLVNKNKLAKFYNQPFGFSAFNISNRVIIYQRIWKCANDGIRLSLQQNSQPFSFHPTCNFEENMMDEFLHNVSRHFDATDKAIGLNPAILPAFTFVRDPIDHFVSGTREYFERVSINNESMTAVTVNHLVHFIRDVLDLGFAEQPYTITRSAIPHIYPQATTFRAEYNIQYIGRLSSFERDWDEIMHHNYQVDVPYNSDAGFHHKSSTDPYHIESAFKELPTSYLRAICWMVAVDFVCLGYAFPDACIDIGWKVGMMAGANGKKPEVS